MHEYLYKSSRDQDQVGSLPYTKVADFNEFLKKRPQNCSVFFWSGNLHLFWLSVTLEALVRVPHQLK